MALVKGRWRRGDGDRGPVDSTARLVVRPDIAPTAGTFQLEPLLLGGSFATRQEPELPEEGRSRRPIQRPAREEAGVREGLREQEALL